MRNQNNGFTLIELMITIAIAAILLALAAPGFRDLLLNNRIATQNNDLISDLALARSEAAKRGGRVTICTSSDGATCTNSNWDEGRILFVDASPYGAVGTGDTILRVREKLANNNTLTSSAFTNTNYIQYFSSGIADSSGSFKLCDSRTGAHGNSISISNTGRASTTKSVTCP